MTVLSFPAAFSWMTTFGLTIDGDEQYYVIRSEADNAFYYPVGEQSACRNCVRRLLSGSGCLKFIYVPEQELTWLEELGFEIRCEPDTSEYVYSSASLALLDRKSGKNYREKVRHFSRDYQWTVQPLLFPRDEQLLKELTDEWERTYLLTPTEDRLVLYSCAEYPLQLDLSGIYIKTQDGEWAFLLGYPSTPEIFDFTIIKYSPDLSRNVVPACLCEAAKRLCDTYPYINLEDDLGVPGLRTMKKLYRPVFLLNSYSALREVPD